MHIQQNSEEDFAALQAQSVKEAETFGVMHIAHASGAVIWKSTAKPFAKIVHKLSPCAGEDVVVDGTIRHCHVVHKVRADS